MLTTSHSRTNAEKGREQFAAVLKDLTPLVRKNHLPEALELLDARQRDPAFADVADFIKREKSDLAAIQTLRSRAMEALRGMAGSVVTLKKGKLSGTVKAEANKDGVLLLLLTRFAISPAVPPTR